MNKFINHSNYKLVPGKRVMIHAFKYTGWLYRCWDFPTFLFETNDYVVLDLINCKVISSEKNSKRNFVNKISKPTYWVFMKNDWFNFRITLESQGPQIYVNIASPFFYEESAVKYYDFDIDFKCSSWNNWREVDINEFMENSYNYFYPKELKKIIFHTEQEIWKKIKAGFFKNFISNQFTSKLKQMTEENQKIFFDKKDE
mgnify:CR=1 FL=1